MVLIRQQQNNYSLHRDHFTNANTTNHNTMIAQSTPITTQAAQPRRRSLQANHPTPIFAELVHSLRNYTQQRQASSAARTTTTPRK